MENFIRNELFLEASLFMFQTILSAVHSTVQSCHLLGVTLFRNWNRDYSLTNETTRPVFSANNSPSWSDTTEKPFMCLLLPPLFPMMKSSCCWYCSPNLNLVWWLSILVSCKRACQHAAWSPVCNTALLWREWLTACLLLCFWGQLLSDSAGRLMALVFACMSLQCASCLVSYRMQGLVRSLNRESVLRLICLVPRHPGNRISQVPVKVLCDSSCIPGALLITLVGGPGTRSG